MRVPESVLKKLQVIAGELNGEGEKYEVWGQYIGKVRADFKKLMDRVVELVRQEEEEISQIIRDVIDAYEELHIFHTINDTLASLLDENEVSRVVLDRAVDIVKAKRASVMLLDETGERMHIVHARGLPDEVIKSVEVKLGDPYAGWVLEKRKPLLVEDIDSLPKNLKLPRRGKYSSRSFLIVPILARDVSGQEKPLGVINLADKEDGVFTAGDLKLVMALARAAGAFILNTRLIREMRKNELIRHELELAANIQKSLLPPAYFENEKIQIAGFCGPASYVGGDYYDYVVSEKGIRALVSDVSGHGLGAALYMSSFRSFFRALRDEKIESIFERLNRLLYEESGQLEMFVTSTLIEIQGRKLNVTIAGHPPPIIFSNQGEIRILKTGGLPLGIFENVHFSTESTQLNTGDTIFIYTDGLIDAMDSSGERFGLERVKRFIVENLSSDVREIVSKLKNEVLDFTEGRYQDDLTFVILRPR